MRGMLHFAFYILNWYNAMYSTSFGNLLVVVAAAVVMLFLQRTAHAFKAVANENK